MSRRSAPLSQFELASLCKLLFLGGVNLLDMAIPAQAVCSAGLTVHSKDASASQADCSAVLTVHGNDANASQALGLSSADYTAVNNLTRQARNMFQAQDQLGV